MDSCSATPDPHLPSVPSQIFIPLLVRTVLCCLENTQIPLFGILPLNELGFYI